MHCRYIGSRAHISDVVKTLRPSVPTVVIDAVTLNREGIEGQLSSITDQNPERAVVIRPAHVNDVTKGAGREYLEWVDAIETGVSGTLPTTTSSMPRSAWDWKADMRQAQTYGAFCTVIPGEALILASVEDQIEALRQVLERDKAAEAWQYPVRTATLLETLDTISRKDVHHEILDVDEMRAMLAETGMSDSLAQRIIGAQQLSVTAAPKGQTTPMRIIDDWVEVSQRVREET